MTELTAIEVLGAATEVLLGSGFEVGPELALSAGAQVRCFEDSVSIVGIVQYPSWTALRDGWIEAQSVLVDLLSERLDRSDPKSWEGYLVLLTLDHPTDPAGVDEIRRDTTRLRKVVATGGDMSQVSHVEDALLPVIPLLDRTLRSGSGSILERLPELLEAKHVDPNLTRQVVEAFEQDRSVLEAVSSWRAAQ